MRVRVARAGAQDTLNFGFVGLREADYEWITRQLVKIANAHCKGRIVSVLEGGYRVHVRGRSGALLCVRCVRARDGCTQGSVVSAFGRSVAAHVRALAAPIAERSVRQRARVYGARPRVPLLHDCLFFVGTRGRWNPAFEAAAVAADVAAAAHAVAEAAAARERARERGEAERAARNAAAAAAAAAPDAGGAAAAPAAPAPVAREEDDGGGGARKRRRVTAPVDYAALDAAMRAEERAAREAARAAAAATAPQL